MPRRRRRVPSRPVAQRDPGRQEAAALVRDLDRQSRGIRLAAEVHPVARAERGAVAHRVAEGFREGDTEGVHLIFGEAQRMREIVDPLSHHVHYLGLGGEVGLVNAMTRLH